jgi:2-dehydropantoate 2-reductase
MMNIVVLGAGAIGSYFGGMLSKDNNVILVGRKSHIDMVRNQGLLISGKTRRKVHLFAVDALEKVEVKPDLIIVTVKAYDTVSALTQAKSLITEKTLVLSLQNGLDTINNIKQVVSRNNIIGGVTTNGVLFSEPGCIVHTGVGKTVLGELDGKKTKRIMQVVDIFNQAGIETAYSEDIFREFWVKAIINSSINPLTAVVRCKNGYLLKNPILERMVEKICAESTLIARAEKIDVSVKEMVEQTKQVIRATKDNFSSMVQSVQQGKKTEIDWINGKIVEYGSKQGTSTVLNDLMVSVVRSSSR